MMLILYYQVICVYDFVSHKFSLFMTSSDAGIYDESSEIASLPARFIIKSKRRGQSISCKRHVLVKPEGGGPLHALLRGARKGETLQIDTLPECFLQESSSPDCSNEGVDAENKAFEVEVCDRFTQYDVSAGNSDFFVKEILSSSKDVDLFTPDFESKVAVDINEVIDLDSFFQQLSEHENNFQEVEIGDGRLSRHFEDAICSMKSNEVALFMFPSLLSDAKENSQPPSEKYYRFELRSHSRVCALHLDDAENIRHAEQRKIEGNTLLKKDNLPLAEKKYLRGLEFVAQIGKKGLNFLLKKLSTTISLYNNLSLVYLRQHNWHKVVDASSKSIALNSKPNENTKAYLRRGVAYRFLIEFTNSRRDFEMILSCDPNDTEALHQMKTLQETLHNHETYEKRVYRKAFAKGFDYDDVRYQGYVCSWSRSKGCGRIRHVETKNEYFVHFTDVRTCRDPAQLYVGERLEFQPIKTEERLRAGDVTLPGGIRIPKVEEFSKEMDPQKQVEQSIKKALWEAELEKNTSEFGLGSVSSESNRHFTYGTCKEWNLDRGFGVITNDKIESTEYFVHCRDILSCLKPRKALFVGEKVRFEVDETEIGRRRKRAIRVTSPNGQECSGIECLSQEEQERSIQGGRKLQKPSRSNEETGLLQRRHTGKCIKWIYERGFGFVESYDTEVEYFVHATCLEKCNGKIKALRIDEEVEFDVETKNGRQRATAVTAIGGSPVSGLQEIPDADAPMEAKIVQNESIE